MMYTQEQKEAAMQIVFAVRDAIQELGSVPSGELYARLMSKLSLKEYNYIIDILTKAQVIKVVDHEIIWIGKPVAEAA